MVKFTDEDRDNMRKKAFEDTKKLAEKDPNIRKMLDEDEEINRKRLTDDDGNEFPVHRLSSSEMDFLFDPDKITPLQRKFEFEFDEITAEEAEQLKKTAKIDDKPLPMRRKKIFSQATKEEFARGGFMGNVNHKTMFTVGEQNHKEFVSIKPNNNLNFFSSKKSKGKSNNIFDVGF